MRGSFSDWSQRLCLATFLFGASACVDNGMENWTSPLRKAGPQEAATLDAGPSIPLDATQDDPSHDAGSFAASCYKLLSSAKQAVADAVAAADKSCKSADDCLAIVTYLRCAPRCSGVLVSRAGATAVAQAIADNDPTCTEYQALQCPPQGATPCHVPPVLACVDGTCKRE
jgi:hypothetical protein